MSKLLLPLLLVLAMTSAATAIRCVSCDDANCTPPSPGCELGRRVCSCCEECRVKEGGACGPFSVECESHLVCYTSQGVFVGRPPVNLSVSGRCARYETLPESVRN